MNDSPRYALTVVIASHNRRDLLRRCLDALAEQTQDSATFEILVADDGSSDGTREMLARARTPFRLRTLALEKVGKSAALNAAIEAAEGGACLFIDDDVIASPGLVAEHVAAHEEDPSTLGIGRLVQQPPRNRDPYARAAAKRWNERYEGLAERALDWADCYGGNFSAPRSALVEVDGFATNVPAVEDLEIGFRLTRAGCVPRYLPRAEAVHDDEKLGRRILAHEQRFGAWSARFAVEHPETRSRLIGWFAESTPREVALRRLLLALRLPPVGLARLGSLIPGGSRRQVWLDFVSRYAFWHGVREAMSREDWRQTIGGVPVLMYHAFTDSGEKDRYILPRRSFARQMRLLAALRYRVVGFEEVARALREGRPLPRRAVAITIDDGYEDNFEIAYPILRRHGFAATLFLISERLGTRSDWSSEKGSTDGRPLLSLEQARLMLDDGLAIGAHTRTHRPLPELSAEAAGAEIGGSRADLESALGTSVSTFAYPYGEFDEQAADAVRRASFLAACTTYPRHARFGDDPLLIPRIEVRGSDTTRRFLRKLWLGGQ